MAKPCAKPQPCRVDLRATGARKPGTTVLPRCGCELALLRQEAEQPQDPNDRAGGLLVRGPESAEASALVVMRPPCAAELQRERTRGQSRRPAGGGSPRPAMRQRSFIACCPGRDAFVEDLAETEQPLPVDLAHLVSIVRRAALLAVCTGGRSASRPSNSFERLHHPEWVALARRSGPEGDRLAVKLGR